MVKSKASAGRDDDGLVDFVSGELSDKERFKPQLRRSSLPDDHTELASRQSSPPTDKMAVGQLVPLIKNDAVYFWASIQTCNKRKLCSKCMQRKYWKWYIIFFIVIAIGTAVSMKHRLIVTKLEPFAKKIRLWPGGWLIPVALLVIVSFPPLIGHEIIGLICGLIYGLGWGFLILAGGTFLGELATWFAFKSCCTARAAKFEKKNIYYASLTQLIREKSFAFVLILRFSAIPGHIVTAISSSAGAHFLSYCAAAFLTLPKQLALVYLGTAFKSQNHTTHLISLITLFLTILGTGIAAIYVYYQMRLYLVLNGHSKWPSANNTGNSLPMSSADLPRKSYSPSITSKTVPETSLVGPLLVIENMSYEKSQSGRGFARRPFLHSNSSFVLTPRTLSRANSLPASGAIESQDYLASHPEASPRLNPQDSQFNKSRNAMTSSADLLDTNPRQTEDAESSRLTSMAGEDEAVLRDRYYERGTASMDLWRPESMTLGQQARPRQSYAMSGREIAADADEYARRHGRPDYGRSRGDSSAALLGRPPSLDDEPTNDSDIGIDKLR